MLYFVIFFLLPWPYPVFSRFGVFFVIEKSEFLTRVTGHNIFRWFPFQFLLTSFLWQLWWCPFMLKSLIFFWDFKVNSKRELNSRQGLRLSVFEIVHVFCERVVQFTWLWAQFSELHENNEFLSCSYVMATPGDQGPRRASVPTTDLTHGHVRHCLNHIPVLKPNFSDQPLQESVGSRGI